jgi:hypothetical protein
LVAVGTTPPPGNEVDAVHLFLISGGAPLRAWLSTRRRLIVFGRPDATLASPSRRHGWLHLLTFASNGLTVFSTGGRDELGGAGSSLGLNLHDGRESGDLDTDGV